MTETARTPGPWKVLPDDDIPGHREPDRVQIGAQSYAVGSSANARLISAAPELLKALQAAQGVMWMAADWLEHGGSSTTMGEDYQADYDRADALINAAIARATGEKEPEQ